MSLIVIKNSSSGCQPQQPTDSFLSLVSYIFPDNFSVERFYKTYLSL